MLIFSIMMKHQCIVFLNLHTNWKIFWCLFSISGVCLLANIVKRWNLHCKQLIHDMLGKVCMLYLAKGRHITVFSQACTFTNFISGFEMKCHTCRHWNINKWQQTICVKCFISDMDLQEMGEDLVDFTYYQSFVTQEIHNVAWMFTVLGTKSGLVICMFHLYSLGTWNIYHVLVVIFLQDIKLYSSKIHHS